MLRITRINGDDASPLLRLEGRLTRAELAVLEDFLAAHGVAGARLDLAALRFADAAGVARLRSLVADGALIAACSPFIDHLLSETTR
jgi:ABC-type transporter Mla MlaB component